MDGWLSKMVGMLGAKSEPSMRKAFLLAKQASDRQTASNPLIDPSQNCFYAGLEMAEILADLNQDESTILAAINYRAVREQIVSLERIETEFGAEVVNLIAGVQKMAAISSVVHPRPAEAFGDKDRQIENIRKMLVAMIDDVRIALLKLAERTWAIRAAKNQPQSRKEKVAREAFDIYAPLAHRLGIGQIKWELEDVAFRYLSPNEYKKIAKLLDERRLDRDDYIENVIVLLQKNLFAVGIDAAITGRAKHIYGIWRKMQSKNVGFDQVHDVRAVRILVSESRECYAALGVAHSLWRHIPNEFDDYIATPKRNGYKSIHTAVIGPEQKVLEVQIRTHQMHREAEFGVCSHWHYKGAEKDATSVNYEEKIAWLRQVLQWHEELGDPGTFTEAFRLHSEPDRIYILTPAGHVVELGFGATPLDFAYRVHTEIGHHAIGAIVDGHNVALNSRLDMGSRVEILTSDSATPKREWLNPALGYVASPKTKSKIQQWFKLQDKSKNLAAGRYALSKELSSLALTELDLDGLVASLDYGSVDQLYASLGAGEVGLAEIINVLQSQLHESENIGDSTGQLVQKHRTDSHSPSRKISEHKPQIGECCEPEAGDECAGYITPEGGLSIHRADCPVLIERREQEPERLIDVHWRQAEECYCAYVTIVAFDRTGLLRDIATVLTNEGANVISLSSNTLLSSNMVNMNLTMEVKDLNSLSRVFTKLRQLPNLVEVKRIMAN